MSERRTDDSTDAADLGFDALGVPPVLVRSLAAMDVTDPTRAQRRTLPPAMEGRDVAVVASTGTGKTLAYLLPLAARLLAEAPPRVRGRPVDPRRRLRALVLCPTRELAQQVAKDAQQLFRGTVLRAGAVYGKSALAPQREMVREGLDLLVGTPGRVKELCEADALSLAFVKQVVLDEADRMLDMGFLPQAKEILSRAPESRQLLFLTATMPRPVETVVEEMLKSPARIDLVGKERSAVTGTPAPRTDKGQHLHDVSDEDKAALTVALVKDGKRKGVMVFVRTRRRAGWVAEALRRHDIRTVVVHGDRSQRQRTESLAAFAAGKADVLVATDVAARGLHVPAVRTVINYDVPLLPEEYVHRVGRAGHGGGSAEAITLRGPADVERWHAVARTMRVDIAPTPAPGFAAYRRVKVGVAPDVERAVPARGGKPGTRVVLVRTPGAAGAAAGARAGGPGKPGKAGKSGKAARPAKARPGAKGPEAAPTRAPGAPSAGALIRMGNAAAMRATGKKKKKRRPNDSMAMRGSDRGRAIPKGQRPGGGVRRTGG